MELIDRQALLNAIEKDVYASDSVKSFVRCVAKRLPTIDAVPVRHGEWILQASGRDCKCSVCESYWIPFGDEYDYKYCPNCGARMDMDYREPPKE